jgi:hypothetical protein
MMRKKLVGYAVCLLGFLALSVIPALAQAPAKTGAPITLTFNWEGAYGRANCLVWPFRPGGSFEQLVTKHTNGMLKLDIKENCTGSWNLPWRREAWRAQHLQETGECLEVLLIKFKPTPLPTMRNAPVKKFQVTGSSKIMNPAIPVNTTSDIKIKDPSEALQNLNP